MSAQSASKSQHLAALLEQAGAPLQIKSIPTQAPGDNEVLIEVSSLALNPVDYYQRERGFMIKSFPAVLGSDISGTIVAVGKNISVADFPVGVRVLGYSSEYFCPENKYGAFQKYVVTPVERVTVIPDTMSFNEAVIIPMGIHVAMAGWYSIGLPFDFKLPVGEKAILLVWGAATSVGTYAIQTAKLMGYTIYATASPKHHEYLKSLGAHLVFDYKDPEVVNKIVQAASDEKLYINLAYRGAGDLSLIQSILSKTKEPETVAKIASAPLPLPTDPVVEGVEAKFILHPQGEEEQRKFHVALFNVWLKEKLITKDIVPSPAYKVEGGLEDINKALDELMKGVSGLKLVLEI